MFQDTQPAPLGLDGGHDRWSEFRVGHPGERLALLRQLRDGSVPVILSGPDGGVLSTSLWSIDTTQSRLHFAVAGHAPQLQTLLDADEAVGVAYLESVKLQFDLSGLVLIRRVDASTLQTGLPTEVYRFQRRSSFRVRPAERAAPTARLRHPSLPDMGLSLRVVDVSLGGCALVLPHDVPPLEPGIQLANVQIELDADTRFAVTLQLHHVTSIPSNGSGVRLGCEFVRLGGSAERALQRYIDQTQKRRRLLSL